MCDPLHNLNTTHSYFRVTSRRPCWKATSQASTDIHQRPFTFCKILLFLCKIRFSENLFHSLNVFYCYNVASRRTYYSRIQVPMGHCAICFSAVLHIKCFHVFPYILEGKKLLNMVFNPGLLRDQYKLRKWVWCVSRWRHTKDNKRSHKKANVVQGL
jgi:hypothetical protein